MMPLRDAARDWWHRQTQDAQEQPDFWRRYLDVQQQRQARRTPLDEIRFVVLDTETTGLDHKHDRVVSFGAVRVVGHTIAIVDAVDWRIRTTLPSSQASIEIHGLLNGELETGLPEGVFVHRLAEYVGADVLVGYRPGFDLAILNRLVRSYTGGRLTNPTLDVFELGMRLDHPVRSTFINPEPYRLDALCTRFDVDTTERHTALGDAYSTALLLLKLLERLRTNGLKTLGDLLKG